MNDHTEPLVTLALGDPAIVPPTFADVIDVIISIDPGLSLDGHTTTIDRIVDELNDTQMDVVKTIAALITLRQAATSHQAENHPGASHVLDHAWDHYRAMALAPYGDAETVRTETQYAARISWDTGYDEIHPRTVDGTSRYEAEQHAQRYNEDLLISARRRYDETEPGASASASVVRRTVVYGPWYAV